MYHVSEGAANISSWLDHTNRGTSTQPCRSWFVDAAADGHDPGGADGIELDVPDRTYRVEPAPDPMEL